MDAFMFLVVVQLRQDARRPQRCEGRAEQGETRLGLWNATALITTSGKRNKEKRKSVGDKSVCLFHCLARRCPGLA